MSKLFISLLLKTSSSVFATSDNNTIVRCSNCDDSAKRTLALANLASGNGSRIVRYNRERVSSIYYQIFRHCFN